MCRISGKGGLAPALTISIFISESGMNPVRMIRMKLAAMNT